jgi:hypothetical protein
VVVVFELMNGKHSIMSFSEVGWVMYSLEEEEKLWREWTGLGIVGWSVSAPIRRRIRDWLQCRVRLVIVEGLLKAYRGLSPSRHVFRWRSNYMWSAGQYLRRWGVHPEDEVLVPGSWVAGVEPVLVYRGWAPGHC